VSAPRCICAWHDVPVWINPDGSPGERVPPDEAKQEHSHGVCTPCAEKVMGDYMRIQLTRKRVTA
jgi:hypothetical protein